MKIILGLLVLSLIFSSILFFKDKNQVQSQIIEDFEVPLYLSIETDSNTSKPIVYNFINDNFINIIQAFPTAEKKIMTDILDVEKVFETDQKSGAWKYPNSWHTTILYMGQNPAELENPIYLEFVNGKQEQLKSSTFVYLPGKIMCSPVFPQEKSNNKVPHMTLMAGNWSPVKCNDVLEATFYNDDAPLKEYYNQLDNNEELQLIKHLQISVDDTLQEAFVIKVAENSTVYDFTQFDLEGVNTTMYSDD